ncbi:MAG: zeta toxin family protein, partial [Candidatus Phytoplasma australasiaticum]|nr:zeta toxin family protein [Candidatus Phytoplasma australasiaticum]
MLFYQQNNKSNNNDNISTQKPQIYLFVGVNGSGKTTTIGKLATQLVKQNKKVLLIAADTFRTGAIDQLESWSITSKSNFFSKNNSQPASVIFEGLKYSKNQANHGQKYTSIVNYLWTVLLSYRIFHMHF